MKIKRNCAVCGIEFWAIKSTQLYHTRKCFKRSYYLRQKALNAEDVRQPKFPLYNCSICGIQSQLDFDPVKHWTRFEEHKCPNCGFARPDHWLKNTHFVFAYTEVVITDECNQVAEKIIKHYKKPF